MSFFRVCVTLSLLLSPMPCSARHQSSELPARINEIMQARSAVGDFSGVALVARRGRILYQHAFGLANREWNVANDLDTRFEIGSMTKQFTAMLILQMVNAGEIRLDGRLSDYLPYCSEYGFPAPPSRQQLLIRQITGCSDWFLHLTPTFRQHGRVRWRCI
jgi:CubicO group peptidase (beta-lactamase class C family)